MVSQLPRFCRNIGFREYLRHSLRKWSRPLYITMENTVTVFISQLEGYEDWDYDTSKRFVCDAI